MSNRILTLFFLCFFCLANAQTGSWIPLDSNTNEALLHAAFPNAELGYVVGTSGTILKTYDGGANWIQLNSGVSEDLYRTFFFNEMVGFVAGNGGTLLRTINGGDTWTSVDANTSELFREIYFWNATDGVLLGGESSAILRITTNGGITWIEATNPGDLGVRSAEMRNEKLYFTSWTGTVYETTFPDIDLQEHNTDYFAMIAMTFKNDNEAFAITTAGDLIKTTDAWTSWSSIESNTTDALTDIRFSNEDHGFIVGGSYSTNIGRIMHTEDGGDTWNHFFPGTSRLYSIIVVNENCMYITGLDGTILKYVIPESVPSLYDSSENQYEINIMPNPASDLVTVSFDKEFLQQVEVFVTDMNGKVAMRASMNNLTSTKLNVSDLAVGLYTISVNGKSAHFKPVRLVID